jgi:hypothetical protein
MLGVVEYMTDPEQLFADLSQHVEFIVLSYNATDTHPRRVGHWITHLSRPEIRAILRRHGFHIERETLYERQMLLRTRNERFSPEMRSRREAARLKHRTSTDGVLHARWQRMRHGVLSRLLR